jgi:hypothetical protein
MKAEVEDVSVKYAQECDETDDWQGLKLFTNDNGGGKFIVISTERWAIDSIDELIEILNDFKLKAGIK